MYHSTLGLSVIKQQKKRRLTLVAWIGRGALLEPVHFTEMSSVSEAGSYLRLIDSCITQLKAQGPSRTCNKSEEEEEEERTISLGLTLVAWIGRGALLEPVDLSLVPPVCSLHPTLYTLNPER